MRRLRHPPLRWRVTAAFSLAAAVVLAVLGVFLHVRLVHRLHGTVDSALRQRLSEVTTVLGTKPVANFSGLDPAGEQHRSEDVTQLLKPDGTVLASEGLPDESVLAPRELAAATSGDAGVLFGRVGARRERLALLAGPVQDDVVVVGTDLNIYDKAVEELDQLLLLGLPGALLFAALAGYLASRVALTPVDRMRERAEAVGVGTLGERLPELEADDELRRLAHTLNTMLDRLQEGYRRERAFVDDAAHELRTPLTLLRGELELSTSRPRTAAELEQTVATARVQTERLVALANDLLVLARSADGQLPLRRQSLDAAEVLNAAARRAGGEVLVDAAAASAGHFDADRLRVEQALDNLVLNALHHGEGRVVLSAERDEAGVVLSVTDQGSGLDPAIARRAFDRFARGDAARGSGGTGLGLAIVKAIAEAHGGSASLEPSAGGTRAWLRLPAA